MSLVPLMNIDTFYLFVFPSNEFSLKRLIREKKNVNH